jgi:hypothetical protein
MAFRPPKKQPQFADLKGILAQYKDPDNALYQTVQGIIERLSQFQTVTLEAVADINQSVSNSQTTINITDSGFGNHYDTPLTDGDPDETDLIFASGECIIVQVPV